jgi:hypothetical protein
MDFDRFRELPAEPEPLAAEEAAQPGWLWGVLTSMVVVLTLIVLCCYLAIFVNPQFMFNPFKPPTAIVLVTPPLPGPRTRHCPPSHPRGRPRLHQPIPARLPSHPHRRTRHRLPARHGPPAHPSPRHRFTSTATWFACRKPSILALTVGGWAWLAR